MNNHRRPNVDEALALIRASTKLVSEEVVATAESANRVTAERVRAVRSVPAFRTAAMDGFAVRSADIAGGDGVLIAGTIAAGHSSAKLPLGTAVAISTGASVPAGADRVIPREHARTSGNILQSDLGAGGSNIRAIGEDMRAGAALLESGQPITPDAVGAMIACGCDQVTVRRRPRLAVLSTGTELVAGSEDAGISDSNRPMIAAAARDLGLDVSWSGVTSDHENLLEGALDQTADTDLIVSTGGVSVGDYDFVRQAIERHGAEIMFHGVAMRPGKPMLFARLPDGRAFFGLPGNPVAALVCFRFFVSAAVRELLGLTPEEGEPVGGDQTGREGTTLFLRGRRTIGSDFQISVNTAVSQRSHILSSVVASDCWLRVDQAGSETRKLMFPKCARLL